MNRFQGKVAGVTGAAQGIGAAIALRFAQEGAAVILLDLAEPTAAADACRAAGVTVLALTLDVTQPDSIAAAVACLSQEVGPPDIWVNNAGIFDDTPLTELSEARWDAVIDANYKSMFLCARQVAPPMLARRWGRIINIASMAAKVAFPNETAYCSSKAAVVGLTRALGVELGPHGITVNAICPGPIDTTMLTHTYQRLADQHQTTLAEWRRHILKTIPVGRYGRPADVAGLAAFLASADAEFINAQAINIDGGMVFY